MHIDKKMFLEYLNKVIDGYTKKMKEYHADSDIYKGYESAIEEYESLVKDIERGIFDLIPTDTKAKECPDCGWDLVRRGDSYVCTKTCGYSGVPNTIMLTSEYDRGFTKEWTDEDVKEIEEAVSKIDGGKWYVERNQVWSNEEDRDGFRPMICKLVPCEKMQSRAEFIANAPTWLRLLLTKYTETLAQVERLRGELLEASVTGTQLATKHIEKETELLKVTNGLVETLSNKLDQALEALDKVRVKCPLPTVLDIVEPALQSIKGETP